MNTSKTNNTHRLPFRRFFLMRKVLLIFFLLLLTTVAAQKAPMVVGQSFRIHPSDVSQTETFIAKSPADENVFFVSCNTLSFIPFFISEGIYSTTDAGESWTGNDTCTGSFIAYHGGDPGITIDKNGRFILTRLGRTPFTGLYSHYSDSRGLVWSPQQAIATDDLERAVLISDATAGSPGYGMTYAAWIRFAPPFPLMFARTGDAAVTWSAPRAINNPSNRSAGGDLALGPGGILYACWAGVTDVSPFREIYAGFARSADAGETWNVTENAFPMSGITGVLPGKNTIRVNGLPSIAVDTTNGPRRGWIYIVTGQKGLAPAGNDPDIILNRSTDGGQTWSAGIRVNQDPVSNGRDQYFPAIHIDQQGVVNVIFYDDRTTTIDSASVFLARSADGGDTWTEFEICDHHFRPEAIGGLGQGYQGDNIDLSSNSEKLIPVWMDNSTGIYQLWTNPIRFTEINGTGEDLPGEVQEFRISPNPYTSTATISFRLDLPGMVKLEMLDLTGKVIYVLLNEKRSAGLHHLVFRQSLAPGIYLCRLIAGEYNAVKRIEVRR